MESPEKREGGSGLLDDPGIRWPANTDDLYVPEAKEPPFVSRIAPAPSPPGMGCWVAYILFALVVLGLWAVVSLVDAGFNCTIYDNCDKVNWVGVWFRALSPALVFLLFGIAMRQWRV